MYDLMCPLRHVDISIYMANIRHNKTHKFAAHHESPVEQTTLKVKLTWLSYFASLFPFLSLSSLSAVKTLLSYWLGCRPNLSFLFVIQCSPSLCRYYIFKHPNFITTTKAICYFIHDFSLCLFFIYYQHSYRHYCQLLWSILNKWASYSGRENRKL